MKIRSTAFSCLLVGYLIFSGCKKKERNFGSASYTTCDMTSEVHVNQDSVTTDSTAFIYEQGNMAACEVYERNPFVSGSEGMQLREHLAIEYNDRSMPKLARSVFGETADTIAFYDYDGELLTGVTFFGWQSPERYTLTYKDNKVSNMLIEHFVSGERWYLTFFYHQNGQLDYVMAKSNPNDSDEDALMYYVELDTRYKNSRYMKPAFSAVERVLSLDFFTAFELESVTLAQNGETVEVETKGLIVASNPQGFVTQRENEGKQIFWNYQCR